MDLTLTEPELRRRYEAFVHEMWARNWEIWISSATRSLDTQASLYRRWLLPVGDPNRYDVPSVANPYAPGPESPWGWQLRGSFHTPQADGFSHALDIGWRGCSDKVAAGIAADCGLAQTVPNEVWHFQAWDAHGWFPATVTPAPIPQPAAYKRPYSEGEAMILTPTLRPDGLTAGQTLDFTHLPADGPQGDWVYSSVVHVRRRGAGLSPGHVEVFFDGKQVMDGAQGLWSLPGDGTAIHFPVAHAGMASVRSAGPDNVGLPVIEAHVAQVYTG